MSDIRIKSRTTLSDERHRLERIEFEKQGKEGLMPEIQRREIYQRPDAVCVLLVDRARQALLLTRQLRVPAYLHGDEGGYLLEACAGVMDEGETPEETVVREALEETGYAPVNLRKIGCTYASPAFCMERVYLFVGDIDLERKQEEGGGLEEEGEEIEPVVLSYDEARRLLQEGAVRDMKTLALLQYLLLRPEV